MISLYNASLTKNTNDGVGVYLFTFMYDKNVGK